MAREKRDYLRYALTFKEGAGLKASRREIQSPSARVFADWGRESVAGRVTAPRNPQGGHKPGAQGAEILQTSDAQMVAASPGYLSREAPVCVVPGNRLEIRALQTALVRSGPVSWSVL